MYRKNNWFYRGENSSEKSSNCVDKIFFKLGGVANNANLYENTVKISAGYLIKPCFIDNLIGRKRNIVDKILVEFYLKFFLIFDNCLLYTVKMALLFLLL